MVNKQDLLNKTGYVEEDHLRELVKVPEFSGGWTTLPCIGAIIVATIGFDACPTSACTKSCNR